MFVLSALTAGLQTPAAPQLPTFRTGVDIVELDVTVMDKDRRPVHGLTAADFTILERGKPQPVVAFAAIDVPPPVPVSVPWLREAPLDVFTNASESRRIVTIVMDDAYARFDPDVAKRAKRIASDAIDQLGPADLASVVFTFQGRPQNFTADREKLRAAVASYIPKSDSTGPPLPCVFKETNSCDVQSLSTVAAALRSAPPGRKIAILIGGGRAFSFGEMGNALTRNEGPELQDLFRDLQRANITVYSFDAHGLENRSMSAENRAPQPMSLAHNETLYSFAESTGGRAIANTNNPEALVPVAFQESSSYYLIGFQSSDVTPNGRFHKIEVKVARDGVDVRTRNGYFAPFKERASDETLTGLPTGDLLMDATAAVLAAPGRAGSEVIVAGHLHLPVPGSVALTTTSYDLDGKPHGVQSQTMTLNPGPGSRGPDLLSHLPLSPGRYMIRLAADHDEKSGQVFIDVDVPDFSKVPLSMSGFLVQRAPAPPVQDTAIASLIPIAPTTQRTFAAGDEVTVFARVYQGGKGRPVPVRISAKVTSSRGEAVSHQDLVLEANQFGESRAADYQVQLPIAHLEPGDYLFEVEAKSGAPLARRTIRFSIR